jgi:hypothetical protein
LIVEFNSSGTSNFAFDTSAGGDEEDTVLPVLIFSVVHIEKGLFSYKDAESGLTFAVRLDRLDGGIPGFDKSLKLDFEGAFRNRQCQRRDSRSNKFQRPGIYCYRRGPIYSGNR